MEVGVRRGQLHPQEDRGGGAGGVEELAPGRRVAAHRGHNGGVGSAHGAHLPHARTSQSRENVEALVSPRKPTGEGCTQELLHVNSAPSAGGFPQLPRMRRRRRNCCGAPLSLKTKSFERCGPGGHRRLHLLRSPPPSLLHLASPDLLRVLCCRSRLGSRQLLTWPPPITLLTTLTWPSYDFINGIIQQSHAIYTSRGRLFSFFPLCLTTFCFLLALEVGLRFCDKGMGH